LLLHPLHAVRKIQDTLANVLSSPSEDYVSITLTDEDDLDIFDMQDRLNAAFPNLLEVRRSVRYSANYDSPIAAQEQLSPFALCQAFLNDLDASEEALLAEIINKVQTNDTEAKS
jgi:exonuclease SbcD